MRVKICGITSLEDALAACEAGADALGFVFYESSKRYVTPERAAKIASALPPFVTRVALFVDASADYISNILDQVEIDVIQFHGSESPEACASFSKPYIKAIAMKSGVKLEDEFKRYDQARAFLLDTYCPDTPGGTGKSFNWELFPEQSGKLLILAGGLTPENIEQAIVATKPYAVDVSGGVEDSPGVKSIEKVKAFIDISKRNDR